MCFIIDIFQASPSHIKWIAVLLTINSVFSLIYLLFVSLLYVVLDEKSTNWVKHWAWIYFGIIVLLWAIIMLTITIVWCLCRNYALSKTEVDTVELGQVSEKAKKALGIVERKNEKSCLIVKKPDVEDIKIEKAEITPLPEYSPEARNSIFDFSEESLQKMENERSRSPFRDFLHLVPAESPSTPEKSLQEQCLSELTRISEEPMYDIPLRAEPPKQNENVDTETNDEKPLVSEKSKKGGHVFLGDVGKKSSVLSELFVELDKGNVIPESVAVIGRYQVLSE